MYDYKAGIELRIKLLKNELDKVEKLEDTILQTYLNGVMDYHAKDFSKSTARVKLEAKISVLKLILEEVGVEV